MTHTIALIKPDAVRSLDAGNIIRRIEARHPALCIASIRRVQWTPAAASSFYAEHLGRPYFNELVKFMASGPLYEMVLTGPDAVVSWRDLMGSLSKQGTIRGDYGAQGGHPAHNAVHGSDSEASAKYELAELIRRGHPFP